MLGEAQAGEQPVARGGDPSVDDVAALFAAHGVPARVERFEHVPVADRCLDDVDALTLHRPPEAEVGHHRDDHRVVHQMALLAQLQRGEGDQPVAVDHVAEVVDRDDAVAVAVERETEMGALGDHGPRERRR